ncbi:unnamed protein product [Staurois parvus]|uniref:Uncharacterized protein n=1 Tax=Staurois parvus TaxID=386267 RepID=A0ABN9D157_9NEOB|nr:unnamed protein product [Staurois parvus]
MICWLSPNHWHSERHRCLFSIQPLLQCRPTRIAAYMWCPALVLVFYLAAKIQVVGFLNHSCYPPFL